MVTCSPRSNVLGALLVPVFLGCAAFTAMGCGLEAQINDLIMGDNVRQVVQLSGDIASGATADSIAIVTNDGTTLADCAIGVRGEACVVTRAVDAGSYSVELEQLRSGDYNKLTLQTHVGDANYLRLVPSLKNDNPDLALDARATTTALLLQGVLSAFSRTLQTVDEDGLQTAVDTIADKLTNEPAHQALLTAVETLYAAGVADALADAPPLFVAPVLLPTFAVQTSALNPAWLAGKAVDVDGDGTDEVDTVAFDALFRAAVQLDGIDECLDPDNVRVVFAVDFNAGHLDENCNTLQRFRWVQDLPNKSMWFVGGIHEDSPVQSTEIDAMLGNNGSWSPNTVPMVDDGTNGDAVAGDGIWSITFILPKGTRVGYKYTWGLQGSLWTGTEEWPGNQRILEIVDGNGDNIVYRYDYFADETTNKDKANLNTHNPNPGGLVDWTTDVNGDAIPDAQERPVDVALPNTCADLTDDAWVTPAGIGPAVIPCGS